MNGIHYVGGTFGWLSPFALLCGVGLCLGYALLGAGWLTYKTETDTRDLGYRLMPWLLGAVLLFLVAAGAYAAFMQLRVLHRWVEPPEIVVSRSPARSPVLGCYWPYIDASTGCPCA